MNAVVGVTKLLKETNLTAEQREMVETIQHSGESLLTIINDILDFSRLESKKLVLESIPFSLRDVRRSLVLFPPPPFSFHLSPSLCLSFRQQLALAYRSLCLFAIFVLVSAWSRPWTSLPSVCAAPR